LTYIVQADIEARLGPQIVQDILDDDYDGTVDANAIAQVIADAEGYVEGFLRGTYNLNTLRGLGLNAPHEVKRLCLDVVTAYLWERHPEYVRADGEKLLKRVREDLMDLRQAKTRLDIEGSPEPTAVVGGVVFTDNLEDSSEENNVFIGPGKMGIF
jgi:phage gp36-like protein